jgi:DNA-binding transcriptional regulator YhcF (GntR family)
VLFVHSKLDDSGIPYHPMRVLAHLRRALGKRKCGRATGIRRMCKVCRMEGNTVEQALDWLEEKQFINIHRKLGKPHEYELRIDRSELYVDHRLDELGLSPVQFRVLMHIARLAGQAGEFFISVRKFATICGMKRETVNRALQALEDLELYTPYVERKNPMCILILDELFPKESKTVTDTVNKTSRAKTPNSMPETPNGSGPKDLTPMPETPNGGWPDSPNERQSNERLSIEDNPKDNPREDNPAFFINSKGRPPVSPSFGGVSENGQKQLTESKKDEESPDEQIERLTAKFAEFSAVDVRGMGAAYKGECEAKGGHWKNKVFEQRVGKAVDENIRPRL